MSPWVPVAVVKCMKNPTPVKVYTLLDDQVLRQSLSLWTLRLKIILHVITILDKKYLEKVKEYFLIVSVQCLS